MPTLKDIARTGHVTRWHLVRTQREQGLAEHHYLVCMIAREMAKRILPDLSAEDRLLLYDYCLTHDLPELITGDWPTPAKRRIAAICAERNIPNPLEILEQEVDPELVALKRQVSDRPIGLIVKLADLADSIVFSSAEGSGRHAERVTKNNRVLFNAKIDEAKYVYPDFRWDIAKDILEELENGEDTQMAFEDRNYDE